MAPKKQPVPNQTTKDIPAVSDTTNPAPAVTNEKKDTPNITRLTKEIPIKEHPENVIMIGDKLIEIKPTKVRYQRDRTAAFYRMLELYPQVDILGMEANSFGDGRDGDKAVFDWLIAVTDDPELITANYDLIDTGTVEKLMTIFRRVNKIDEKEEKLKNVLAPGAKGKS